MSYLLFVNKVAMVVSSDYAALTDFAQSVKISDLPNTDKVTVTRWTGQAEPRYSSLSKAKSGFDDKVAAHWLANEYMPEVTEEDHAIADLAEESNLLMHGV
jgi:hypothetical protein